MMIENAEDNMGNASKEDAQQFFDDVKADLHEPISLDFTTAGSICIGSIIYLDYRDLQYPWFTKQMILHEIAHYLEPTDYKHGTKFHYQYANLVQKYLGSGVFLYEEHERGYDSAFAEIRQWVIFQRKRLRNRRDRQKEREPDNIASLINLGAKIKAFQQVIDKCR